MKKYVTSMALLLAVAGCATAAEEATPVTNEPSQIAAVAPVVAPEPVEEKAELNKKIAAVAEGEATTENLTFDDDVSQFESLLVEMASWQSYTSSFDNYDNYFDKEANIDRDYHASNEYVANPLQITQKLHSIGLQNSHIDRYITKNAKTGKLEGVERFLFEEWQVLEDAEYYVNYIEGIAPARAEMLQHMIDFSDERLVSEDGKTLTLNILPEKSKAAYKKLQMGVHFTVTEAALTQDIQEQIELDESNVEMVSAIIYSDGTQITGYDLDVYMNFVSPQETDHHSYTERFSEVNTLTATTTPDALE